MARPQGIRGRIVLLVTLGAIGPMAALGLLAGSRIDRLQAQAALDRELLALTLAERLRAALERELAALAGLASDAHFDALAPGAHDAALLDRALSRSPLLQRAFVARGAEVVAQPAGEAPGCARQPASTAPGVMLHEGAVCLLVPVEVGGRRVVIGGVVDPAAPAWRALLEVPGARGVTVTLEDGAGRVVLGDAGERTEAAVTAVPVALTPWRLRVAEPDTSGAAPGRRALGAFALAALVPLVLVFAWGAARSLTRPLAALGEAADRIAAGHLEEPLPDLGPDEVGRLGRCMESMRQALQRALEAAARANARLEQRVEERTRELERLNVELRERERARGQLLRKVITAQEEERKRIARELHDESCQTLSVLAIKLDELGKALGEGAPAEAAAAARALAVRTLEDMHRLIFDLRPSVLDDLGLPAALRWLVTRHLEPAGIAVRMEVAPLPDRLPVGAETALFRAAQEALVNIARHAGATSVLVQVGREGGCLAIEIEDDGRGFDVTAATALGPSGRGLGLLGLRERMELLGGSAAVESAPGAGTRVVLKAPLRQEKPCLASAS